ncbi:MAG: phosphoglucosamine mutase [Erysipelotrichaceae bacterium]
MGKYFGTDGVRGLANDKLTLDIAIKIGKFLGAYYGKERHAKILIGKDTRLSSSMFEMGLAAGATAAGAKVYLLGVCPTPAVSYLINKENFDCGIMVSASHNPYYDNGIKVFNSIGKKMEASVEAEIEAYIDGETDIELAINESIGQVIYWNQGLILYESWLKEIVPLELKGMRIALDLANGSATSCAVEVLSELGANLEVIHSTPNGVNINTKCGSTHPEELQELVRAHDDIVCGFAFDGDADRLIAVDSKGNLVDGDKILYICGSHMKAAGNLKDDTVVTTVMSNLGLYKAFERAGLAFEQTAVGDKYVYECMETNAYGLGGEQSGHIIFNDHANTGDGLLTAMKLLEVMVANNQNLEQLSEDVIIYPQLLINVPVNDKSAALSNAGLLALVKEVELALGNEGRILVRPSGTEPLIRVMVEAKTDEICKQHVQMCVDYIKQEGL